MKIINTLANKEDNKKKLSLAHTNERHLFIPITRFCPAEAFYLNEMNNEPMVFSEEKLKELCFEFPNQIDVIWISTIFNFDRNRNISCNLAKVYKKESSVIFERVTPNFISYVDL